MRLIDPALDCWRGGGRSDPNHDRVRHGPGPMAAVHSRRCCGCVALTGYLRRGRDHGEPSRLRRRCRRSECCGRCACSSGMPACLPTFLPAGLSTGPPLRRKRPDLPLSGRPLMPMCRRVASDPATLSPCASSDTPRLVFSLLPSSSRPSGGTAVPTPLEGRDSTHARLTAARSYSHGRTESTPS
jgi:hypothetical protein